VRIAQQPVLVVCSIGLDGGIRLCLRRSASFDCTYRHEKFDGPIMMRTGVFRMRDVKNADHARIRMSNPPFTTHSGQVRVMQPMCPRRPDQWIAAASISVSVDVASDDRHARGVPPGDEDERVATSSTRTEAMSRRENRRGTGYFSDIGAPVHLTNPQLDAELANICSRCSTVAIEPDWRAGGLHARLSIASPRGSRLPPRPSGLSTQSACKPTNLRDDSICTPFGGEEPRSPAHFHDVTEGPHYDG
jgi:hypothetical protein